MKPPDCESDGRSSRWGVKKNPHSYIHPTYTHTHTQIHNKRQCNPNDSGIPPLWPLDSLLGRLPSGRWGKGKEHSCWAEPIRKPETGFLSFYLLLSSLPPQCQCAKPLKHFRTGLRRSLKSCCHATSLAGHCTIMS